MCLQLQTRSLLQESRRLELIDFTGQPPALIVCATSVSCNMCVGKQLFSRLLVIVISDLRIFQLIACHLFSCWSSACYSHANHRALGSKTGNCLKISYLSQFVPVWRLVLHQLTTTGPSGSRRYLLLCCMVLLWLCSFQYCCVLNLPVAPV